jgi:hypothetical protein
MSLLTIRQILETRLATVTPPIATAPENVAFSPVAGEPYQAVYVMPARPDNVEMGPGHTEQGLFQVNLFYPLGKGAASAVTRAEAIRAAFRRGLTLAKSGLTVLIPETPEVAPGRTEDDRFYMVPVKVRYSSYIGG